MRPKRLKIEQLIIQIRHFGTDSCQWRLYLCAHSEQPWPLKSRVHDSEKSLRFNRKEPSLTFCRWTRAKHREDRCCGSLPLGQNTLCSQRTFTEFTVNLELKPSDLSRTRWADEQTSWRHRATFTPVYIHRPEHHVEAFGSTGPLHPCSAVCRSLLKAAAFPVVVALGNHSCNISRVTGS